MVSALTAVDGVERAVDGPFFHEALLTLSKPTAEVLSSLATEDIQGGYDSSALYPEYGHSLLVCATETKTDADIDRYAAALARAMSG